MLYPSIEPFASGVLGVVGGDGIYWETSGNPDGKPAIHLHGGPGSGLGPGGYRRRFDPQRYLIVGIDQRGCGRSRPLATDARDQLHRNTTQAIIGDIEALRAHLGIERWLVSGISWGTTLALAYAQAHPDRVTALVLVAVTTTSREEIDWITVGARRIFPEAWQRFERAARKHEGERVVEAYARRLAAGDERDRAEAARDWNDWERALVSLDHPLSGSKQDERGREVFATLVSHFWANDGFLRNGSEIFARIPIIDHVPAVLIHGRRDIGGPAITAWRLHRQWPASRLVIVESEGHGGPESIDRMRIALDSFAAK